MYSGHARSGVINSARNRFRQARCGTGFTPGVALVRTHPAPFGINREGKGRVVRFLARPRVLAAAPTAPVVVKEVADGFEKTPLEETLTGLAVTELLVCGTMTQNRVTHTAISKAAEEYAAAVLPDCCATVGEVLHLIALHAVSTRIKLVPSTGALWGRDSLALQPPHLGLQFRDAAVQLLDDRGHLPLREPLVDVLRAVHVPRLDPEQDGPLDLPRV